MVDRKGFALIVRHFRFHMYDASRARNGSCRLAACALPCMFSTRAGAEHAPGSRSFDSSTEFDKQARGFGYVLSSTYSKAVLNSPAVISPLAASTPTGVIIRFGMSTQG